MINFHMGYEVLPIAICRAGTGCTLIEKTEFLQPIADLLVQRDGKMRIGFCRETSAMPQLCAGFSALGLRTVILLCAHKVSQLQHLTDIHSGAGMLIILLETEATARVEQFAHAERLSLFLPEKAEDIYTTVRAAMDYAEILEVPSLLYLSREVLFSGGLIKYDRLIRPDFNYRDDSAFRKRHKLITIAQQFIRQEGSGEIAVIVSGGLCDVAETLFRNIEGIVLITVRRILPWPDSALRRVTENMKMTVYIGNRFLCEMLQSLTPERRCIEVTGDNRYEKAQSILCQLSPMLPKPVRASLLRHPLSEMRPGLRIPTLPPEQRKMCPGCPMRIELKERLDAGSAERILLYERAFCRTRMIYVHSGIQISNLQYAGSEYELCAAHESAEPVFTLIYYKNRVAHCPHFPASVRAEHDTDRENQTKDRTFFAELISHRCNHCGRCLEETGCPALWKRGVHIHLDSAKCMGCGLCTEICKREAIVLQAAVPVENLIQKPT